MRTAKTDQTGRRPRLIWVFAGRTGHFVGFVMRRLISYEITEQSLYNATQDSTDLDIKWSCPGSQLVIFLVKFRRTDKKGIWW